MSASTRWEPMNPAPPVTSMWVWGDIGGPSLPVGDLQGGPERIGGGPSARLPGEECGAIAAGLAQPIAKLLIAQQPRQAGRDVMLVGRVNQQRGVARNLGEGRDVRRQYGDPRCEPLEDGEPEALVRRGGGQGGRAG